MLARITGPLFISICQTVMFLCIVAWAWWASKLIEQATDDARDTNEMQLEMYEFLKREIERPLPDAQPVTDPVGFPMPITTNPIGIPEQPFGIPTSPDMKKASAVGPLSGRHRVKD